MTSVLIVDDDIFLHKVLERILSVGGYSIVTHAYNGAEAVELLRKSNPKPDIILMDYRMPVLDGLVAMKEILRKTPNAKVLFVSAEKRVEKDAIEAGAIGFFTKPTSIRTLLDEIDRIQKLQTEVGSGTEKKQADTGEEEKE